MSKMSKAIAALGVVAGLGVAALPLSTYAALADETNYQTSTSVPVQVEVEGAISIASNINADETGDGVGKNGVLDLGKVMPGTSTADMTKPLEIIVSSNSNNATYDLYMYASNKNNNDNDNAMVGENTGATIKAGDATTGSETWGYEMGTGTDGNTFAKTYAAVPAKANAAIVATGLKTDGEAEGVKATSVSKFNFKVATKTTTAADTYKATVVFTAVAR